VYTPPPKMDDEFVDGIMLGTYKMFDETVPVKTKRKYVHVIGVGIVKV
jgi:hypothetical protein